MNKPKHYFYNAASLLIGIGLGFAGIRLVFLVNNYGATPTLGYVYLILSPILIIISLIGLMSDKPLPKAFVWSRRAILFLLIAIIILFALIFIGLAKGLDGGLTN